MGLGSMMPHVVEQAACRHTIALSPELPGVWLDQVARIVAKSRWCLVPMGSEVGALGQCWILPGVTRIQGSNHCGILWDVYKVLVLWILVGKFVLQSKYLHWTLVLCVIDNARSLQWSSDIFYLRAKQKQPVISQRFADGLLVVYYLKSRDQLGFPRAELKSLAEEFEWWLDHTTQPTFISWQFINQQAPDFNVDKLFGRIKFTQMIHHFDGRLFKEQVVLPMNWGCLLHGLCWTLRNWPCLTHHGS